MKSFSRTEILIGKDGLNSLAKSHILIAGLGGVGGALAESLVRAGLGTITIIDFDKVDISNINRQIIATHSTIGKQKTLLMKTRLLDINPRLKIIAKDTFINAESAFEIANNPKIDFVADCIDSIFYKVMLIENCLKSGKKIISSMGAGGKLDTSKIKIDKMEKTINCNLAREIRRRLRLARVKMKFPVVFSTEVGKKALPHIAIKEEEYATLGRPKATNGVISYMPNIFGLMMSSHIINELLTENNDE